jgi:hypothetical protein
MTLLDSLISNDSAQLTRGVNLPYFSIKLLDPQAADLMVGLSSSGYATKSI